MKRFASISIATALIVFGVVATGEHHDANQVAGYRQGIQLETADVSAAFRRGHITIEDHQRDDTNCNSIFEKWYIHYHTSATNRAKRRKICGKKFYRPKNVCFQCKVFSVETKIVRVCKRMQVRSYVDHVGVVSST